VQAHGLALRILDIAHTPHGTCGAELLCNAIVLSKQQTHNRLNDLSATK